MFLNNSLWRIDDKPRLYKTRVLRLRAVNTTPNVYQKRICITRLDAYWEYLGKKALFTMHVKFNAYTLLV